MPTRQKIIEVAIKLFNEKGCENTSTRHIADEMGISVGNLYYHFKNKEEIIMAINNELMGLLTKRLTAFNEQIDMPFDFYDNLQARMQIEERYRFLRFEMSGLYMNYPKVKQTFEISLQRKQEEIKKLIAHQIKFGYIVPLDEVELDFLCSNLWIINSQWEIYWLINKEKSSKLRILQGKLNFLYLFKPYLTQKALDRSNFLQTLKFIRQEIKNAE